MDLPVQRSWQGGRSALQPRLIGQVVTRLSPVSCGRLRMGALVGSFLSCVRAPSGRNTWTSKNCALRKRTVSGCADIQRNDADSRFSAAGHVNPRSGVLKASARTRGPDTFSHLATKHNSRRKIMQVIMGHTFTCVTVYNYGKLRVGNNHSSWRSAQAFKVPRSRQDPLRAS